MNKEKILILLIAVIFGIINIEATILGLLVFLVWERLD